MCMHAATIIFNVLQEQLLFEGGYYSGAASIRINTVVVVGTYYGPYLQAESENQNSTRSNFNILTIVHAHIKIIA